MSEFNPAFQPYPPSQNSWITGSDSAQQWWRRVLTAWDPMPEWAVLRTLLFPFVSTEVQIIIQVQRNLQRTWRLPSFVARILYVHVVITAWWWPTLMDNHIPCSVSPLFSSPLPRGNSWWGSWQCSCYETAENGCCYMRAVARNKEMDYLFHVLAV
jgi:uncharacterized protein YceK